MKLSEYRYVHCIGVGGIGLSAIARYCLAHGATVSGSDGTATRITEDLQKEGVTVYIGHNSKNLNEEIDLLIYSIAVPDTNPELEEAHKRGITCLTYPEALGLLTQEYTTIAVCGTHGKTTTTAMMYYALKGCGINPTIIVGSLLSDGGTNFIQGDSKYLIVEACEYKRSFLNLVPSHILVTNIDEDHLDYYKDLNDIYSAFQSFAGKLPQDGYLVMHGNVSLETQAKKLDADSIDRNGVELSVLGKHNQSNAQLVITLLRELGFEEEKIRKGLQDFRGTWRRLEYKGEAKGAKLYDDYGHHPTEIKATLSALREKYLDGKFRLFVVFQPHLYSRTKLLLNEFAESFTLADKVIVMPIYASREKDDGTISSLDLVEKMHNAIFMETFEEVKKYLDKNAHSGSVVLTIGAGDVYRLYELFGSIEK